MSNSAEDAGGKRPGGRTAETTGRIQSAVIGLLTEAGAEACTFKAVAERAEVERSTLYRRYPDRWEMMLDALLNVTADDVTPELGDSFPGNLENLLRTLVTRLESPLGPAILSVAAGLRARFGVDYSRAFFDRRMEQLAPMFDQAIATGQIPRTVDREAVFTFAAGPIWYRVFIAARGVDDDFIRSVVSSVCWLYCSPSIAAKVSLPHRIA